jgi:hypothetical protein
MHEVFGEVSPLFTPRPNINFPYYLGLLHTKPHKDGMYKVFLVLNLQDLFPAWEHI